MQKVNISTNPKLDTKEKNRKSKIPKGKYMYSVQGNFLSDSSSNGQCKKLTSQQILN